LEVHAKESNGKFTALDGNYKVLYMHYSNSMTELAEAIRKINGQAKQGVTFGGRLMVGSGDVIRLWSDQERLRMTVDNLKNNLGSTHGMGQGIDPQVTIQQGERLGNAEGQIKKLEKAVADMISTNVTQKRNLDNLTNDFKQYKLQKK
jgi:hypothetical protein